MWNDISKDCSWMSYESARLKPGGPMAVSVDCDSNLSIWLYLQVDLDHFDVQSYKIS